MLGDVMTRAASRVNSRMGPSAGWVTCKGDDPTWTHVLDSKGRAWARGEDTPPSVFIGKRSRFVRPKLHGEQLDLLGGGS